MPLKFDDGGHDESFVVGSPRTEVDSTTRCHSTFYRYRQTAAGYQASRANNGGKKWTDTDGSGAYFVGQGQPRELDCGIFEWEDEYARVPPSRVVPASYSHPYQFLVTTDGNTDIEEETQTVSALFVYDYFYIASLSADITGSGADTISNFLSADPTLGGSAASAAIQFFLTGQSQSVPGLAKAYRAFKIAGNVYTIGTAPSAGQQYTLGEDQSQTQYKGNIYERKTVLVPVKIITAS